MRFHIDYPKKSIAVTKYGFNIEFTHIRRIGNVIQAQVYWSAPKNDGYFLFKQPAYSKFRDKIIFPSFNKQHPGLKFALSLEFRPEHEEYDTKSIIHSISKDGAFVSCILDEKSITLVDCEDGRQDFNFNIDGPDYKGQWVFENNLYDPGYRCKSCQKKVFEGDAMVCSCDLKD